MILSVVK